MWTTARSKTPRLILRIISCSSSSLLPATLLFRRSSLLMPSPTTSGSLSLSVPKPGYIKPRLARDPAGHAARSPAASPHERSRVFSTSASRSPSYPPSLFVLPKSQQGHPCSQLPSHIPDLYAPQSQPSVTFDDHPPCLRARPLRSAR